MTAIWFTSDLHIGHRNITVLRGFDSVEAHDHALAANWDAVVQPGDQVWVLGDLYLGGKNVTAEKAALQWISERPGQKHLIAGNHDDCHPMHREAHKSQRRHLGVFESVQQSAVRKIRGRKVRLSHFPYAGPGGDHTTQVRYPEWRFPDDGTWLLHGHTHTDIKVRGHQIHVGVDAHGFTPVSLHWIEGVIEDLENTASNIRVEGTTPR